MKIHPTAIVEPGAELGAEVEVGPYAVISARAVIGAGTIIHAHVILEGAVRLGEKNTIGYGAIIGSPPQDLNFRSETQSRVEIGDENVIREYCTIHRGTAEGSATVMGSKNFLMVGAHLAHNCRIGDGVVIANNCLLAGYVEVQDHAFLGGGSVFHQYVRVGQRAITQGLSGIGQDLPPFLLAAQRNSVVGLNTLGLRRAGYSAAEREELKRAFKLLYRSGYNTRQALEKADETEWGERGRAFFEFVRQAGRRGIAPYVGKGPDAARAAEQAESAT